MNATNSTLAALGACAIAIASARADAATPGDIGAFVGTWSAESDRRVAHRDPHRRRQQRRKSPVPPAGTPASGIIRGMRLEGKTQMSPTGKAITATVGGTSFTLVQTHDGTLSMTDIRRDSDGR